jgi:hypothetical protein
MPLSLDPEASTPYALKSDADKPEASRPVFLLKFLTCRLHRKVNDLIAQALDMKDNEAIDATLNEILSVAIAGWRNMGTDYPPDRGKLIEAIDDLLVPGEKAELAWAVTNVTGLTAEDKKKSDAAASSPTADSAPVA